MLVSSATLATFGLAGCLDGGTDDGSGNTDEEASEQEEDTEEDETTEPEDLEIAEFELLDRDDADAAVASIHGDHWHGGPLEVPRDDGRSLGASAEDEDGNAIEFGDEYALAVEVAQEARTGVVASDPDEDFHGDHIGLHGEGDGSTAVVFQIRNDGHVVYETPDLEAVVVGDAETDTDHDESDHNHDGESDHNHDSESGHNHNESDHEHDH